MEYRDAGAYRYAVFMARGEHAPRFAVLGPRRGQSELRALVTSGDVVIDGGQVVLDADGDFLPQAVERAIERDAVARPVQGPRAARLRWYAALKAAGLT